MKQLLKLSFLFVFILFFQNISAQKYGIEAGFVQPKQSGAQFRTTYFNGARLGGNVEFELKNNFSLLTGALYSLVYSDRTQYYTSVDSVNYKTFQHALEIPIQVQYSLPVSKNFKFFAFAGPNIGIGLAQPQKVTAVFPIDEKTLISETKLNLDAIIPENMKQFVRTESDSYADNDLYVKSMIQRINLQISIGGGVQFKNYKLKGGYDFGINSINKIDTSKLMRLQQNGWFVSLIYQF